MTYNPDTAQGLAVSALADAGTVALTDVDVLNRAGIDYRSTVSQRIVLFRKTPAGSRTAALPAVLTGADHDKNVLLTGTTGALSVDVTVADGFRCHVINTGSGAATFSGITGILGATSLASGAVCTVMNVSGTTYAATAATSAAASATAYTTALAATSGNVGSPVAVTLTPTGGAWPAGEAITLAVAGVSGSFSPNPLTPPSNSSSPLVANFTPSTAGTATISSSTSPAMTNTTGSLTYAANQAVATAYTIAESASSGAVSSPVTLTFAPVGGAWPSAATITPASTLAGTFSALTLTAGSTTAATCTFVPSAVGTATFSATNNAGLTNPSSLTYNAFQAANAYTTSGSATSGVTGAALTLTFTPTGGGWPTGETITPTVSGVSGTFSPATMSPAASSTSAVTCTFTPSSAGTATLNSTTSPALTNTTGALNYAVTTPVATAYTLVLSAASGNVNSAVTLTFTPADGGWPSGETITPTATSLTGSFAPASITPVAGSTAAVTCTFTPTTASTGSLNATTAPALTNNSGAQTYTATAVSVPPYTTITTTGATRLAIYDASVLAGAQGSAVTSLADQSGNGRNLAATVGVSVGASVNGLPSIAFAGTTRAANSGLKVTGSWVDLVRAGPHTLVYVFRQGVLPSASEMPFDFENSTGPTTFGDAEYALSNSSTIQYLKKVSGAVANQWSFTTAPVANRVNRLIVRQGGAGTGNSDIWLNGTKVLSAQNGANSSSVTWDTLSIGQAAIGSSNNYGMASGAFLEMHIIQGVLADADVSSYNSNLLSKWGA